MRRVLVSHVYTEKPLKAMTIQANDLPLVYQHHRGAQLTRTENEMIPIGDVRCDLTGSESDLSLGH